MRIYKILFIVMTVMIISGATFTLTAQISNKKTTKSKTPTIQRLYFDQRGQVSGLDGNTMVINDRTYQVLSSVTLLSLDQRPLSSLDQLKRGDHVGFTVDNQRRIDAIYLLSSPKKPKK